MVTTPAEKERLEFSGRLNELLDDMGVPVRGRARRLCEIWEQASGETVSIPGARKWLEGAAIPNTTKIPRLATKLNACSEWLLSGAGPKRPVKPTLVEDKSHTKYERAATNIDRALLMMIIRLVEAKTYKASTHLSPAEKAAAIAGAYTVAVEVGTSATDTDSAQTIVAAAIATARDPALQQP